ncbi:hypothetical protein [Ktedonobacter racemifer]|uniref:Uncharacterized protein n=1 Tax=Ktedonobacter racemifer DSM 44963 TaxID=485913 RepID=D6U8S1_KTERA|nr:hypothetical protein [Ktedonobacter racemifer]EFH79631.1 hypothetical protein Krac_0109 [Ktedonobacter racemifer DSM 44963]
MSQFVIRAKLCVSKSKNKYSNQAQLAGDFMGQKWRFYAPTDNMGQKSGGQDMGQYLVVLH